MKNFLLDCAVNPRPAPLLPKSILRDWACSNCPSSPCCSCCCASFPSAMLALAGVPDAGWKPFLKPPIKRRNFCCWSVLSNWAVLHWPKPWETEKKMKYMYKNELLGFYLEWLDMLYNALWEHLLGGCIHKFCVGKIVLNSFTFRHYKIHVTNSALFTVLQHLSSFSNRWAVTDLRFSGLCCLWPLIDVIL